LRFWLGLTACAKLVVGVEEIAKNAIAPHMPVLREHCRGLRLKRAESEKNGKVIQIGIC
jgi:hypothetical protein